MNTEVQTIWVEALESGRYPQVTGMLTQIDEDGKVIGHCCLGVLQELAADRGITTRHPRTDLGLMFYGPDKSEGVLSIEVQQWAGLRDCNPFVQHGGGGTTLSALNDYARLNFKQIAEVVKAL